MCRINGILTKKEVNKEVLEKMRDSLSYGGPDDFGIYINESKTLGFGHRRLSILDLTTLGKQPMRFNELVITYNGEIYNFKNIADELILIGYSFETESDTEVILKSFECWGVNAVQKFRGMFAFAIWNENTSKLLLCRDRAGVKPLYWYLNDDMFLFASELKAFHKHPNFEKSINHEAVSLFLQTGYIKAPHCIYENTFKLEPGSFLEIDLEFNIKKWKYWDINDQYDNLVINNNTEENIISQCESVLEDSFKFRLVSDVPVGVFLSGGIDSSLLTALLQKNSNIPIKTFTIGFEDSEFNEAPFAKNIAKFLGTDHTELYCSSQHFQEAIKSLPDYYDEPFGDSSAIPTMLVSKLAKKSVTVCLSADGGDELFTGYNRYLFTESLYEKFKLVPLIIRRLISKVVGKLSAKQASKIIKKLPISENLKSNVDARIPKLVETLKSTTLLDFLYSSTTFISPNELKKLKHENNNLSIFDRDINIKKDLKYGAFTVADFKSYLEGDILTKVDRATMSVALEGREPFLDQNIIEFALRLPDKYKIRNGETKWILRQILYKYVPKSLLVGKKMGFGIPLDKWLSENLKLELLEIGKDEDFIINFKFSKIELNNIIDNYLNGKSISPFLYGIYFVYVIGIKNGNDKNSKNYYCSNIIKNIIEGSTKVFK